MRHAPGPCSPLVSSSLCRGVPGRVSVALSPRCLAWTSRHVLIKLLTVQLKKGKLRTRALKLSLAHFYFIMIYQEVLASAQTVTRTLQIQFVLQIICFILFIALNIEKQSAVGSCTHLQVVIYFFLNIFYIFQNFHIPFTNTYCIMKFEVTFSSRIFI